MPPESSKETHIFTLVGTAVLALIALGTVAYIATRPSDQEFSANGATRTEVTPIADTAPAAQEPESLGEELYEKTANPLEGTLPESPATVANPIGDAYKNPFE